MKKRLAFIAVIFLFASAAPVFLTTAQASACPIGWSVSGSNCIQSPTCGFEGEGCTCSSGTLVNGFCSFPQSQTTQATNCPTTTDPGVCAATPGCSLATDFSGGASCNPNPASAPPPTPTPPPASNTSAPCTGSNCNLTYVPLEPLPGVPSNGSADFCSLLGGYFHIALYAGGMLAVIMFIIGGITYEMSEVVDRRVEAKTRMRAALWGLLLLFSVWVILNTINPGLLNICTVLNPIGQGALPSQGASQSSGTTNQLSSQQIQALSNQCLAKDTTSLSCSLSAGSFTCNCQPTGF